MTIDIHCHTSRHPGITRPNGSRYPTPEELVSMLDEPGIDKTVILSTVSPERRFVLVTPEEVIETASQYPDRFIPFCNVDPRYFLNTPESDFLPALNHYKEAGCKGVGEYFPNIPLDHELNMSVFDAVEKVGLPLTFHLAPALGGYYGCYDELHLPRLERVLRAFPDLIFLGHSQVFWAEIGANCTDENRGSYPEGPVEPGRVVELMRAYPNLYGDLSAGSGYNAIHRDWEFGVSFLNEFSDRLLFGTDIANLPQETPIVGYLDELKRSGDISKEVYDRVMGRNAVSVLGLEE